MDRNNECLMTGERGVPWNHPTARKFSGGSDVRMKKKRKKIWATRFSGYHYPLDRKGGRKLGPTVEKKFFIMPIAFGDKAYLD